LKKVLRTLFFFFIGLYVVIHFFSSEDEGTTVPEYVDEETDYADTLNSEIIITHKRVWQDVRSIKHSMRYSLSSMASHDSYNFRDTVTIAEDGTEKNFWNKFYFSLYDHDRDRLKAVQDSIHLMAAEDKTEPHELPLTVVSFVQDIPYHYILSSDSCATHTDFPCVPLQRYGILSPVEFLYSLDGDCDTRTVLLFTLLKNLGFSPIIVNSAQYHHSMLALDIPTEGDYFIHKGRKFYFWETTATGWLPGMLPPEMNNPDYWTIILDYEYEADPARAY
jgi:hypothetical protein